MILAASTGTTPVTAGCRDTAVRTCPDSENGATTSRSACRSPRSGATDADRLPAGVEALVAGRVRATGTVVARPWPSALPPSSGTTGPVGFAGAGLLLGRPAWGPLTLADLPHPVSSAVLTVTPITTSRLASTETGCQRSGDLPGPRRMLRRHSTFWHSRRPASASKYISPKIGVSTKSHSERSDWWMARLE